ncbi:MAG: hypothetical protein V4654_04990 [Bdellovibrionota bacterium]
MKKLILLMTTLAALSCASTHPGKEAMPLEGQKDLQMKISVLPVEQEAKSAFEMFEITIENLNEDWLRIDKTTLLTDPSVSKVSVVVGNDLKSWAEATAYQNNIDHHNKDMALAGTTAAGSLLMVAGGVSKSDNLATAGAVTYLAGLTWAVTDTISSARTQSMGVRKVPSSHIYEPFAVPGKMFLRKWILVNKPPGLVMNNMVLQFETVSGEKTIYEIKL